MLPKPYRLRYTADIALVKRQGQSRRHPLVILLVRKNGLGVSRFAFIASKRVGNAVVRNRRRRLMREAVWLHLPNLYRGNDCLLIARQGSDGASFVETETAVSQLFHRVRMFTNE